MNVAEEVKRIIAQSFRLETSEIGTDTKLSDLAVDSLDVVELVFKFEEKFNIDIGLEPKESSFIVKIANGGKVQDVSFSTVGQIIETVQRIIDAKVA